MEIDELRRYCHDNGKDFYVLDNPPDNCFEESSTCYQWPSVYNLTEKNELTLGNEQTINIMDYEVYAIELNIEDSF